MTHCLQKTEKKKKVRGLSSRQKPRIERDWVRRATEKDQVVIKSEHIAQRRRAPGTKGGGATTKRNAENPSSLKGVDTGFLV